MKMQGPKLLLILLASGCFISVKAQFPNKDSLLKTEHIIPLQVGLFPRLSSNGMRNAETYNIVSVNLLAGESKGVIGAEVSGIYSHSKAHVIGTRVSGLVDFIDSSMRGFQAGGIMSAIGADAYGMQAAGILSINEGSFDGFQAGGLICTNGKKFHGFQAAGLLSISGDSFEGFQAAGLVSVARSRVDGMQAAGLLSYARSVKGLQVALINIADTFERGMPIGLLNIVKHGGLFQYGVQYNDFFNITAFIKTGTYRFHSTLGFSTQIGGGSSYRYGPVAGIGLSIRLGKDFYLEPGLFQWNINSGGKFYYNNRSNQLQQLRLMLNKEIGHRKYAISAGPTLNFVHSAYINPETGKMGLDMAPGYLSNYNTKYQNHRLWIGYAATFAINRVR